MSPPDDDVPPPSDDDAPGYVPTKKIGAPATVMVPTPKAGEVARQEFGAQQVQRSAEMASTAVATQARAMVEARYVMALQRPRDIDLARTKLLDACKRPRFAEAARYLKPIGKGIEGPSIRLAEEAARCMGNIAVEIQTIYDDERQRIIRVSATDLETNLPYSADVTVQKTVERNNVSNGQTVIATRTGSRGQTVYVVLATDDEILNKQNAIASKALRTNLLRLVPADILEEAMDQVYATLNDRNAKDPGAERKRVIDGFATLRIMPDKLKEYLGHDLDVTTPAEMIELRGLYTAIKDGEATWVEAMEHKHGAKADDAKGSDGKSGGLSAVAAANKARREAGAQVTEAPPKPSARVVEEMAEAAGVPTRGAIIDATAEVDEEEANRRAAEPTQAEIDKLNADADAARAAARKPRK